MGILTPAKLLEHLLQCHSGRLDVDFHDVFLPARNISLVRLFVVLLQHRFRISPEQQRQVQLEGEALLGMLREEYQDRRPLGGEIE